MTRCTKFHRPPEHQIRCSTTVIKDDSHDCRPTHFRRDVDRSIRSNQKHGDDMLSPDPPTAITSGSIVTVQARCRRSHLIVEEKQHRPSAAIPNDIGSRGRSTATGQRRPVSLASSPWQTPTIGGSFDSNNRLYQTAPFSATQRRLAAIEQGMAHLRSDDGQH
ncbi:hypothetical protein ACLOJK_004662 [Asimina triloba]